MAKSKFTIQAARLRTFLVITYVLLAALSLTAAFLLSWHGKNGAPWFLVAAISFGFWASVTATCARVSAGEVLGVAKIFRIKGLPDGQDAA